MIVNKINKNLVKRQIKKLSNSRIQSLENRTRIPSTNPDRAHKAVNQTRFSRHGRIFIYCCLSGLTIFWHLNAPIVLTRKYKKHFFFQTITAEDNGGKSNSATVNIKVEDVNDQSPEFVRAHHMFSRILDWFFPRGELRRCVRARTRAMCGRTCACACEKTSKTCVRCACVRAFLSWSHTTHVRPHLTTFKVETRI